MIKKIYLYINKGITPLGTFLVEMLDLFLLGLVAFYLTEKLLLFFGIDIINLFNYFSSSSSSSSVHTPDIRPFMFASKEAVTNTTNTTIVHSNDGWVQGIKSIFIYGSGALQLQLLRGGGTPLQRGFVIGGTIAADAASTVLKNAINDPEYVEKHITVGPTESIFSSSSASSKVEYNISGDSETLSKLKAVQVKKFVDDGEDLNNINESNDSSGEFREEMLDWIIGYFSPLLETVSVDYSNKMLADQIYVISVLLFILCIMIALLIFALLIQMTLYVYSERIKEFFTNKFIRTYISLNRKIIGIEIFLLGGLILYFMFNLSYGLHFLATHRILI